MSGMIFSSSCATKPYLACFASGPSLNLYETGRSSRSSQSMVDALEALPGPSGLLSEFSDSAAGTLCDLRDDDSAAEQQLAWQQALCPAARFSASGAGLEALMVLSEAQVPCRDPPVGETLILLFPPAVKCSSLDKVS
eukprot:CAMPEP_0115059402 /NCGR_PEP_ID=MMETSP0227-20121206/6896_1 /TAXON_ID=89957 /ORGANISM="Polarella glacialis, Strain CCMP 1383" /LENGTH=137 /DNA_ID=CAMNT_0002444517 /DNA_START=154 /DNA_END=567 /DNA_ORIENTATION=-